MERVCITRRAETLYICVEGSGLRETQVSPKMAESAICASCGRALSQLSEGECWYWHPREATHYCGKHVLMK